MKGVVCVIVSKSYGSVVGIGADFDRGGAAGFSTEDNQRRRALAFAEMDFVRKQASDLIVRGMDAYECSRLVDRLRDRKLVKIEYEAVGEEDAKEETTAA